MSSTPMDKERGGREKAPLLAAKKQKSAARLLLLLLAALSLLLAGCAEEKGYIDFTRRTAMPEEPTSERPLVIAFAPVMSPEATRQPYERMVSYIAEKLDRPVTMVQKRGAAELDQLVAAGEADVAFLSTGAYTAYRGQEPIELLAMVETNGTILYRTFIIVAADSKIEDFASLKGSVFAFVDPLSHSGRLAVDYRLLEEGLTPEQYFGRIFYTHHHDKSIWAVANHLADGASIDNQIYEHLLQTNPQLAAKVRIIDELAVAPTGPVVVRRNLAPEEKEQLRRIFYEMADDEAMRPVLRSAVIDRFVPPEGELYEPLRQKFLAHERLSGE
ncbi:phosphate/phosphite/phosphonate ABC transporter substrate-binding protein [uncultured Selenomonas sp.]|uniref:substrate-binding domain-containing protein n=1 Tax=uncultured Selenomonas sp. TaxID=159275 RepID=UPI0028DB1AB4|nr:phosphate/phosphite/phosphonate ABC transporter substrate-binding protein [uncultured Selenomonas sp.]